MLNANPIMVSIIPPIFSHFQAMISVASSINDGIRCIKKAAAFCRKVRSEENESSANRLIKRIAKIQSILAVQESGLVDVFIMVCINVTSRYEKNVPSCCLPRSLMKNYDARIIGKNLIFQPVLKFIPFLRRSVAQKPQDG